MSWYGNAHDSRYQRSMNPGQTFWSTTSWSEIWDLRVTTTRLVGPHIC
jgi:hypothetical protein